MWTIEKTYVGLTSRSLAWLRESGVPAFELKPPAVQRPVLAVAFRIGEKHLAEFEKWALTAQLIAPDNLLAQLPSDTEFYGQLPDRRSLLELKWLAEQLQVPVVEYADETWGGKTEYEWCYEFGPCEPVLLMTNHCEKKQIIERDWLRRKRLREIVRCRSALFKYTDGELREETLTPATSVLSIVLRSFGIEIASYFEPHTREFDWMRYKVQ